MYFRVEQCFQAVEAPRVLFRLTQTINYTWVSNPTALLPMAKDDRGRSLDRGGRPMGRNRKGPGWVSPHAAPSHFCISTVRGGSNNACSSEDP